jgi:hypothetical protein
MWLGHQNHQLPSLQQIDCIQFGEKIIAAMSYQENSQ